MKYKVGDKVLIREWDDMANEYGIDEDGDIFIRFGYFTMNMKHLCGTVQEISQVFGRLYAVKDFNEHYFTDEMIERKVDMTKEDLKTGHIVTLRNGEEYVVYLGVDLLFSMLKNVLVNSSNWIDTWLDLDNYGEDLTRCGDNNYDIMKVEKSQNISSLQNVDTLKEKRIVLWERKETKEMTVEEIEKALGHPVKIVRNNDEI